MRFHYGPIPESADFEPESEGWSGIREPGPLLLNVLVVPVALIMLILTIGLVSLAWEGGPLAIWRFGAGEPTEVPFLILSLLPVGVLALFDESTRSMLPRYLVIVTLVNSALAAGDAVGFALIISQIPGSAVVRNKGWKSFWKDRAADPA